jgi:hypothetical protein
MFVIFVERRGVNKCGGEFQTALSAITWARTYEFPFWGAFGIASVGPALKFRLYMLEPWTMVLEGKFNAT